MLYLIHPGCAVGADVQGKPVIRAAYGSADLEHDIPITTDTIFEAGSVSKQFTAAAVALLARDGRLSLDDPVRKYVPELPDFGAPLTIRMLLPAHQRVARLGQSDGASRLATGHVLTTVGDLLKWNANFSKHIVGDDALVNLMEQRATLPGGDTHEYALGLYVDTYKGVREVDHSGGTAGYSAAPGKVSTSAGVAPMNRPAPRTSRPACAILVKRDARTTSSVTIGSLSFGFARRFTRTPLAVIRRANRPVDGDGRELGD